MVYNLNLMEIMNSEVPSEVKKYITEFLKLKSSKNADPAQKSATFSEI